MAGKLSTDVKIKGKKVATEGSIAKHDSLVHMQLPGTIKFQNSPKKEGKVTGGTEKSVKANGKEVAVIGSSVTTCNDIGMRDNSKVIAAGMAINMPSIADPMKSEPFERERKQIEEKKEEKPVEDVSKNEKSLSEWLKEDPDLLNECRKWYNEKPEWWSIDPDNTLVFYRSKEEVLEMRKMPGESGGHHPHGVALGGPKGQKLTKTNETVRCKNETHTKVTVLQRKVINKIKKQLNGE